MANTLTEKRYRVHMTDGRWSDSVVIGEASGAIIFSETPEDEVRDAVNYALSQGWTDNLRVVSVERELDNGAWERLVSAYRAAPGTEIRIDAETLPENTWVRVGRWFSLGDGTAALVTEDGQHMGIFDKTHVFVTR